MTKPTGTVMKNRYIVFRHGHSLANQAEIISAMVGEEGDLGLTCAGKRQVFKSAFTIKNNLQGPFLVVSSPFLRTRETAEIIKRMLSCNCLVDNRIKERSFSPFEGQNISKYNAIWEADRRMEAMPEIETLASVEKRVFTLIEEIDLNFCDHDIILITHGDISSIAIASSQSMPLSCHREVGALENAEFRKLFP